MTKPLRDLLPAGSARNKIEYLADQMEMTVEALYQEMAGLDGAKNLLANPRFNEFYTSVSSAFSYQVRDLMMTAGQAPDLSRTIGNGRGSMLVSNHWAVEVPSHATQAYRFINNGRPRNLHGTWDKESTPLQYYASDFTLYQVVTVPMNSSKHGALKGRFCLSGELGTKVTVGIATIEPRGGQVKKRLGLAEKTYTFDQSVSDDEPVIFETGEFNANRYGSSPFGMVALYLKVEGGTNGYIYNAALWHSDIYGDSPARFIEQHQPYGYGLFKDREPMAFSTETGDAATNTIKYTFDWYLPFMFAPQQHLILNCRNSTSAVVTEITPNAMTVKFSPEDYNKIAGDLSSNFWFQYSSMPVGIGFY